MALMHELPPGLKEALSTVSETLARLSVRWVLVGSTASYLNGVLSHAPSKVRRRVSELLSQHL